MTLRSLQRAMAAMREATHVSWQVGAGIADAARIFFRGTERKMPTLSARELEGYGLPGF